MALGTTNITTTIVKNEISESSNAVSVLCSSSNVNQWALHKPAFYGTGYDAWTVDSNYYSGFKPALLAASNNYRLGDFRGYDHAAKAPSYFNGNQSYSYYKYEDPDGQVSLSYGTVYYTSNGNAYTPSFHTLDEGGDGTLTGVQAEVDGTPVDVVTGLTQARSAVNISNLSYTAGTYTLNAYYYIRLSDISPWTKDNVIEGGSVDLVVTELPARFTISLTAFDVGSVNEPTDTATVSWRVTNDTAQAIAYTFYWSLSDKSGTKAINVPASSYVDYSQLVFEFATSTPTETWLMRMTDSGGPVLANSVKDITVNP